MTSWRMVVSVFLVSIVGIDPLQAATLRGVVQDAQGQPIANARVDVVSAVPKVGSGIMTPSRYPDCRKWTRTDDQGRFLIDDLDPALRFRLATVVQNKQTRLTDPIDPAGDPTTLVLEDFPVDLPEHRLLEGTVLDGDGKPIVGALIETKGAKTTAKRWWGPVEAKPAVTDEEGHFKMILLEDLLGVDLEITADGSAGASPDLLQPGVLHQITLPKGTTVTGTIVREGQPQAGYHLGLIQEDRSMSKHSIRAVLAVTDRNGQFQFDSLPASQNYALYTPIGVSTHETDPLKNLVIVTKKFMCLGDHETLDLGKLSLREGLTFAGKVEWPAKATYDPKSMFLALRSPAWDRVEIPIAEDGSFAITGLPPESYDMMLSIQEFRLDSGRLNFQLTKPNAFAVRLTKSIDQLVIPLVSENSKEHEVDAVESANVPERDIEADDTPRNGQRKVATGRRAAQLTDEPVAEDAPTLRVRGSVISASGQRIEGARVILRAKIQGEFFADGAIHGHDVLAQSTTDAEGRFLLGNVPLPRRMHATISRLILGRGGANLLVEAEGYGLAATDIWTLDRDPALRIVVSSEADVEGIVCDIGGQSIAAAKIDVLGIASSSGIMNAFFNEEGDINCSFSQYRLTATANEEGHFRLHHLPPNRKVMLGISSPRHARKVIVIDTGNSLAGQTEPQSIKVQNVEYPITRSPLDVSMEPTPTVEVHVVDADDTPVTKGSLEIRGAEFATYAEVDSADGITVVPIAKDGEYQFTYASDPFAPAPCRMITALVLADADRQRIDIRLPATRWLTGRVLDQQSKRPIVGAYIHNFVPPQKEIRVPPQFSRITDWSISVSDEGGRFRIPLFSEENRLSLSHEPYRSRAGGNARNEVDRSQQTIDNRPDVEVPEVILSPETGMAIDGVVSNAEGKSAANVVVWAEQLDQPFSVVATRSDSSGRFHIEGLSPDVRTMIAAIQNATADRIVIDAQVGQAAGPLRREDVKLRLTSGVQLTGRVTRNGRPQEGIRMELARSLPGQQNAMQYFSSTLTDNDGRYLLGGLMPGDRYQITIKVGEGLSAPKWRFGPQYLHTVEPQAEELQELEDAQLIRSQQTLSGIVVDPIGQPVPKIRVSAKLKNGANLARRPNAAPPWTETDNQGRFQLVQLPDEPISLMAYKANPAGGLILYPARLDPPSNQQNIRIVLDPTLVEPIEDLEEK